MNYEDIENDRLFKKMYHRKQLSENTYHNQVVTLTEYCTLCGKTPTELSDEAYTEQNTIIDKLKRQIDVFLL